MLTTTERIAVVLYGLYGPTNCNWLGESPVGRRPYLNAAEAVLEELDLGVPCAATGCRVRQIARRGDEKNGGLTDSSDAS